MHNASIIPFLEKDQSLFHPIVPFDPGTDALYPFDFTDRNTTLSAAQIGDTDQFARYIQSKLIDNQCRYGIGGYNEHRTLYARSNHFDKDLKAARVDESGVTCFSSEARRLHLGTDIWGPVGTRVFSPLDGIVHSFAFNNHFGDYGATIILTHRLYGQVFHTLFGHLSLNSLKNLQGGKSIGRGEVFTEFGMRFENGNWPAHLHFQIILDMQGWEGDYPGVCKFSERDQWLDNSPDPDLILGLNRYIRY
jgi:murein DD-endopeptidase MepM/ murein hydrolase activator NlpD